MEAWLTKNWSLIGDIKIGNNGQNVWLAFLSFSFLSTILAVSCFLDI